MSEEYWDAVRPTYIENWPSELCQLSFSQVDIPLTLDEAYYLGSCIAEFGFAFFPVDVDKRDERMQAYKSIRQRVDDAVKQFPAGAFIRLGSRSPKDSWRGMSRMFHCQTGAEAMEILTDVSERMAEDLLLALKHKYAPHIFVRQYVEMPNWAEFRCFMRRRELIGISQYHYFDGHIPEIQDDIYHIRWAIEQFFKEFEPRCHLDGVIFDVLLKKRTLETNTYEWSADLIEINPFHPMTDPCLFDHRGGGDFDATFRYVDAQRKTKAVPIK